LKFGKYQTGIERTSRFFVTPNGDWYESKKKIDKEGKVHEFSCKVWCANGDDYCGSIREDKREGMGRLTLNNGEVYEGRFKNHQLDGIVWFRQNKDSTQAEYLLFEKDLCVRQSTKEEFEA